MAVDAGADALGFVFWEKSPRKVDPETAREIVAAMPERVEKVGVFVDDSSERVMEIVERTGLTAAQLYKKDCAEAVGLAPSTTKSQPKIIFVVPGDQFGSSGGMHLESGSWFISKRFRDGLFALLLDSSSDAEPGGTGRRFDWTRVRGVAHAMNSVCRTIVAGGLDPSNVGVAMALLRPWGVDVSSGVEASPGKKDPEKVRAFVAAVRAAEKTL